MNKLNKGLRTFLFVFGGALGIFAGVYLNGNIFSIENHDYVCAIEVGAWGECRSGLRTKWNQSSQEVTSLTGITVPPMSRVYKGFERRGQGLQYGNTRDGCNGKLLFSSVDEDYVARLKNSRGELLQSIDLRKGGVVRLKDGSLRTLVPKEERVCQKTEKKPKEDAN